ncbi:SGNH/GDSL hydrolase family protein [Streptomyces sp. NPDC059785]|uniref:SGNH/GDSL hydrolase family protein n=1 Tax=unclassified Streptomyces TaxID=2593676 RepID=UPI003663A8B5
MNAVFKGAKALLVPLAVLLGAATPAVAQEATAPPPSAHGWVGTWESPSTVGAATADVAAGDSLRQVVHVSVGGPRIRVRLSNEFGAEPLVLGRVTVAVRADGADAVPGSVRRVSFRSRTVPAGRDAVSEPVAIDVAPDSDLLVSAHLPRVPGLQTVHPLAQQTAYVARSADHAADVSGAAYTATSGQRFYVTGVDVVNRPARGAVVAFGDSITDGYGSTQGANHRWPDYLSDRLQKLPRSRQLGVLNAGISGNRLLLDGGGFGVKALDRLDEDIFSRTDVRTLVLMEGINDIQQDPHQTDPAAITAAYREIVRQAHAHGIKVIGSTLTPFKGWQVYDETLEATRLAVNDYIRTSGLFDEVVDFDRAVRDPADPLRILPAYDMGDHLHPNDAGYAAMAAAVDLRTL